MKKRRKGREITVHGRVFTWKPGQAYVNIRTPEGKGYVVSLVDLLGVTWDDLERARWKSYGFPITPRSIARWILRNKL